MELKGLFNLCLKVISILSSPYYSINLINLTSLKIFFIDLPIAVLNFITTFSFNIPQYLITLFKNHLISIFLFFTYHSLLCFPMIY